MDCTNHKQYDTCDTFAQASSNLTQSSDDMTNVTSQMQQTKDSTVIVLYCTVQ